MVSLFIIANSSRTTFLKPRYLLESSAELEKKEQLICGCRRQEWLGVEYCHYTFFKAFLVIVELS